MQRIHFFRPMMLLFVALFAFSVNSTQAQEREPLNNPKARTAQVQKPSVISPFKKMAATRSFDAVVNEVTYLRLDGTELETALQNAPREIVFEIPTADGEKVQLLLHRQQILTDDFSVVDAKGNPMDYEAGHFFTGQVIDREHPSEHVHVASLSIVGGKVMGMMSIDHDNYVLGPVNETASRSASEYVLYKDEDLNIANGFTCGSDALPQLDNPSTSGNSHNPMAGSKVVEVQFEVDNRMYQDFGSSSVAATDYVTGMFNMVATIYQNEGIVTMISRVVIWNIPDPYGIVAGSTSGDVLNALRDRKNLVGIQGDLAHLLSTAPLGHGGIAWVDVLCFPTVGYRTAYSNISTTYNNFPLYSWTIDVVTHEMGHNLGSPHTHNCSWGPSNNQALDNCAATEGGCAPGPAPTNGGTIMSYCHLTSAGKNFNLGFGNEPGDLIRSKVQSATCLGSADLDCGSATPIFCGTPVNGTTIGEANNVDVYSCNSWVQSGPEKVYILQTTEEGTITASLSNLTADLDVIILDACSESACLAEGNNTAVVPNAPAGLYFIVVDGYAGAQGNFTLTVNCEGPCFTTGNTTLEYINRVSIGDLDNTSGNDYGYADYTSLTAQVQRGGTAPVSLTPGFTSSAWNQNWRIWIDINKDNDFNDYGELVFSGGPSTSTVSGTMNIPAWAQLGTTRMRVAMRYGSAPTACGTFYGEVEDYTVEITPYCPSIGNTKYEFIDVVKIDGFGNASGNNGGYADFTDLTTIELLKNEPVQIGLSPGFTGAAYGQRWSVFIDLDQDFQFEASEEVFSTTTSSTSDVEGEITVPATALNGETRLRVVMYYGSSPGACSYSFYGETEDYLVSISTFCPASANSSFEFIEAVGIGSLYNESGDDGGYGDFTDLFNEVNAGEPTGILLVPGFSSGEYKEYWRVWLDFNQNKKFEESEMIFEGGPSSDRVLGAVGLPDDLTEGEYGLRVAMRFGGYPEPCGYIGYGEVEDYLLTVQAGGNLIGGVNDRSSDDTPALHFGEAEKGDLTLFPNPAKNVLNLKWENTQPAVGQVLNASGQAMMTFGADNAPTQIDLSNFPTGIYMLQVVTEDKSMLTKRFVKVD